MVRAKNDRGKTTLFNAINYALYGGESRVWIGEWINFYEAEKGDGETYVDIVFEHNGKEYRIKRTQNFLKTLRGEDIQLEPMGNDELKIYEGSKPVNLQTLQSKQDWVEQFLPINASQFCFFDGEMIQEYMKKTEPGKSPQVKKAIETALGITELRHAFDDLKSVHESTFKPREEKLLSALSTDKEEKKKLDDNKKKLLEIEETIKRHESEIANASEIIKKYDNMLSNFKAIADKVADRKFYGEKKNDSISNKEAKEDDLRKQRGSLGLILLEPMLDLIYNTKENPPSIKIFESETAKLLLKKLKDGETDHCICDHKLTDDLVKILESKQFDTRSSGESKLKRLVEKTLAKFAPAMIRNTYVQGEGDFSEIQQNILEWDDRIKKIDSEIGSSAKDVDATVADYNKKRIAAQAEVDQHNQDLDMAKKDRLETEAKIQKLKKNLYKTATVNDDLTAQKKIINFSESVMKAIEEITERFVLQRVDAITKYASDFFVRTTNNPRLYKSLVITPEFEMHVQRADGVTLPSYKYSPSAGASQIVATSLIAGLNRYTARDAPIVIDTPLGRLDPIHRRNLIRNYSNIGKQVLIFYQPGELGPDDFQYFGGSIAEEWEITDDPKDAAASIIQREKKYT